MGEKAFAALVFCVAFLCGIMSGVCLSVWVDREDARAMTERMERLVERENKVRWMEEEIAKKAKKKEGKWGKK